MMSHFTEGMEKSAMSAGIKFVQKWAAVNNDIADEVNKIFPVLDIKQKAYSFNVYCVLSVNVYSQND